MNVAIYARAHEPRGRERLETQLEQCREACRRNRWTIIGEYTDLCHAAVTTRPGLDGLLTAADTGNFERIVVASPTRVFRSYDLFKAFVADLGRVGTSVSVLGVDVPDISLAVEFAIATKEREVIRQRTRAGVERRRLRRMGTTHS